MKSTKASRLRACQPFLFLQTSCTNHHASAIRIASCIDHPAARPRRISNLVAMSKSQTPKPIEIKISTVVAISAILHQSDLGILNQALNDMTGGTPDFFDDEFAVVDVGALDPHTNNIDWPALISLLKSYRLNAVAVRNAAPEMQAHIIAHGLSLDAVSQPREIPQQQQQQQQQQQPVEIVHETAAAQPAAAPSETMIVDTPVRAGQRIYARNADLIVTAAVNNGAELIADGSIHIYAPLRGRALAGATGNTASRIFAMSMEAELVSIAGVYRTFENGFGANVPGHPTQVRRVGDRIEIQALHPVSRS